MRSFFLLSFTTLVFFSSCGGGNEQEKGISSENDIDAARNFIRAALDGNWKNARRFMLQDSTNTQLLDTYESNYQTNMSKDDKRGYHESSITVYDTRPVNDSITIINYSNSYKKKRDSLKVIRIRGEWMVDFKYSFPQTDTTIYVH